MNNPATGTSSLLKYLQIMVLATALLYFGKTLFVPLCYGLLIAIVLYPVCKKLERRRWPRSLAITASLLIVVILFGGLITLLVLQLNIFRQDLPALREKLQPSLLQVQEWIASAFNISIATQNDWWHNNTHNLGNNAGNIVRNTVSATIGSLFTLFLIPVYAALFLYNRRTFVRFLEKLAGQQQQRLQVMLDKVIHTYFNFIKGMVMVYLVVGVLNSIGLLLLGIQHAILFGMLTAFMTIIPYVGIIVSALLPISVAWLTKDSAWYPLGVVGIFAFVQYLEANVIFPRIVATQLNVSTWATLVAIIAGSLLWGVSGMILFIPFLGILKIVIDDVPEWQAVNVLLQR